MKLNGSEEAIMLLPNLSQQKLCNSAALIVHKLMRNCIQANILTGCGKGDTVFIPCIPVISSNLPFQFNRLQFPTPLSFAISINKSQGQTLKIAGLQLEEHTFLNEVYYIIAITVFINIITHTTHLLLSYNKQTQVHV
uniref:ATP-dependent DNA helicase n=1 Tax=Octopus bimaculoides TaxID=37653 RepID=A0A0L8GRV2_OCTBM